MSFGRSRLVLFISGVLFLSTGQAAAAAGQVEPGHSTGCPLTPMEYQRAGYLLREVKVDNVFNFLRVLAPLSDQLKVDLPKANAPFVLAEANQAASALTALLHGRPEENTSPIAITLVVNHIENCTETDGARRLDLVYTTMTSRIPLASGITFESGEAIRADAPDAIGAPTRPRVSLQVKPRLAYTATDRLQAGGEVQLRAPLVVFQSAEAAAWGSDKSHVLRGSLQGELDATGPLAHTSWRLSASDVERPTLSQGLLQRRVMGQVATDTRPFGAKGIVFRLGGSVEDGREEVSDASALVSPGSVAETPYSAMRVFAGVTLNRPSHSLSGAYALMLGGVAGGPRVDYRKSIVDGAYAFRHRVGDHRSLEIDTRATAGWLQQPGTTPAPERFFGGNVVHDFIEGDAWRIRATPVIRSFPNGALNRVAPGNPIGGTNFVSINVTASAPVWRIPLVPTAISSLPQFANAMQFAQETARENTSAYYRSRDPAQKVMAAEATAVSLALDRLLARLRQLRPGAPAGVQERLTSCLEAIDDAQGGMDHLTETGNGPIASFLVPSVLESCRDALGADLRDPMLDAEYMRLGASADAVTRAIQQIDEANIKRKVDEDLGFAFRSLDTVIHDVNGISVGPVFLLDVARIGPQTESSGGGVRYGIGGGVRVTIMNVVTVSAGYAKNPSPQPWEKSGALFVSMEFVDLFR